ncbi:hypothetical protein MY1884_007033 [Beauveria asiatica]
MYQAYVASESGDSCQRSGDSPRSEPADYWDKEEQDHWPDDSSGAISSDDSASVRQRQQTSPPPVRYYSSPPRHQRRPVLSDDDSSYGPQGHNASRSPHGHQESCGRGGRVHPVVKPFAPHRHRFTRAPALSGEHGDGYYAPGYRQTSGYSQPSRYSPTYTQSFGSSHPSSPWYGPRPGYPQSTAPGYGPPFRHNSQHSRYWPAAGDYFNPGASPRQGTYYGGDPRGYYDDPRGYYDDPSHRRIQHDALRSGEESFHACQLPLQCPTSASDRVSHGNPLSTTDDRQAGEEDDVVQLKAVWVSDPSRVDPESSRKSEEEQSGKEVRVEKPDDEASRPHESKARGQSKVPFTNAIITKLPFFTWKTSLCDAKDDSIKGTVINRLLENTNENLVAREVVGKLYDKAYHMSVALPTDVGGPTEMTYRTAVEYGTFILTHDGDEDQDDENRSVQTPVSSSCHVPSKSETGPNIDFETRRQAARKIREPSRKHVKDAVRVEPKMLADLSTDTFGLFIPAELRTNLIRRDIGAPSIGSSGKSNLPWKISAPNDGKSGASVSMPSSSSPAPSLTKDLVDAFEDIVMAHISKAKHLSLANQWMFDGDDSNNRGAGAAPAPAGSARRTPSAEFLTKVEDMIRCGAECLARAHRCLDHARTNLILLSTRTAMGAKISLDYIGIEFLVAVLVGHLQHQGINAESHPEALLELYQKYTAKLQFEANRKPRRRVFLDIQTLQEELDALRSVIDSQQKLLGNYRDLTAPRVSETMNPARENLHPLES